MGLNEILGLPYFWLLVAVMASFLVAAYFIVKEAIASGLEEYSKRERERIAREEERRRRGGRTP